MTSKANFVTVELDPEVRGSVPHPSLLCNVKSLLKKMQQRVLVGDRVKVVSIDWQDGRGARVSSRHRPPGCACHGMRVA